MSISGWIVLGLSAGFIASKVVNSEGQGLLLEIVLGFGGAVAGGFLSASSTRPRPASTSTAWSSPWSAPVALVVQPSP